MIEVSVFLEKNVPIFVKIILIFLKNIHEVPKSISGWKNTSNHFLRVLKRISRSNKRDWSPSTPWKKFMYFYEEYTYFS